MNGSLHLGHGFTISKIEFAVGYEYVPANTCEEPC